MTLDGHFATDSAVAFTGESVISFGGDGCGQLNGPCASAVQYDLKMKQLKSISTKGAPAFRGGATALWTGSQMIVWGGYANLDDGVDGGYEQVTYGDGALYEPTTDTWTPMSKNGAPFPRGGESSVWSGKEMLIWGGWDETAGVVKVPPEQGPPLVMDGGSVSPFPPGDPALSGARYDPITDTWSTMSSNGQPSIRANHAAVWTGTEMIVWGGAVPPFVSAVGNVLSDGGAYNPVTDVWRAIQSAPNTGLTVATSVWTGTEMLVWGGYDETSYSNRGYGYNPTIDSWQYITTIGAPEPRVGAGGVWTGKAFAVFGGTDELPFDDGALWYPDTSDASP
ncbi:MAG TPA: hypothetical protein VNU46_02910 [Gemmatimonadaceae bacterium]|nr:hypothetical protein [Gemmatimonadaceae bacterium]